ncbi:isoleucyl-tRNA ligase [Halosimplex carlsbadense 2-9-1]|uniref:Isoleucine--tRNA ligase n=1 Tax=Halosimplex carlsbadense 2-9-1 TaxID=797114 RepID=M0CLF8_9EURY|nr:isoleucine--tRNA ligase [Halosimplex carlsbadense]ELZ22719.1 isoleucyl-tRNA ligase [Halosimplex carlsbadense 2-9-1]
MPERLPDHYDPNAVEQHVKQHWTDADAFPGVDAPAETSHAYEYAKRRAAERGAEADEEPFSFLDGPPFTSGRMHVGNAWGKVLKDALLRYHRMCGRAVLARPGYDTHGLPVEVNVERDHDFETKHAVEEYGVDRFVDECRAFVEDQRAVMDEEFRDLAVWMDWDDVYQTMDPEYVDTVWDAFAALYERGLVERGDQVVNTCPRCETAVSDSRLEYDDRTVDAVYVGFPLVGAGRDGTLLAWTTTPWTVVGNQFVAVDADGEYAAVAVDSDAVTTVGPLYVAAERVDAAMDALGVADGEYAVAETLPGSDLVGARYRHPLAERLPDHPTPEGTVAHADYVETGGDGTGLVHSAPGFGHEDFERASEGDLDLPTYSPVTLDGRFTDEAGPFAGLAVHGEGRRAVADALDEAGALLGSERFTHEYPRCPRCDTDVVMRAAEQWLVRVTGLKADLLDAVEETTWYPAETRDGRFRNTVEAAPDWNVSRQRYWGSPLPVWHCEGCGRDTVASSRADLAERAGLDEVPEDPHRPVVDEVTVPCPDCGSEAERVADVLDVWFDSAVASWASLRERPSETPRPENWPADLVVEGNDQTRGWFLMQLYLGVAFADRAPYEEVLMHGWALLDGEGMSKSRGHVLRPPEVADAHGRDALRAHLLGHEQQGQDVTMTSEMTGVGTTRERFDVVWNVARFAAMFMAEDGYEPSVALVADPDERRVLDEWVLARLREVAERATAGFEEREPNVALDAVLDFLVADVSRYYVQTVRDRVWTPDSTADKRAAYDTLGTVLGVCVRLLAPFAPHLAERLYRALDGPADAGEPTVHATDWPDADALGLPDESELVEQVGALRAVEGAVATARQEMGRKHRWPVVEVVVETDEERVAAAVETHRELLADRTNAAAVSLTDRYPARERVIVPEMDAVGPAFRDDAAAVADAVEGRPAEELPLTATVDGAEYEVTAEMVSVVERVPDGVRRVPFDGGTVYVDESLPEGLRREGLARDVTRRAQEMRADLDLAVDERVRLTVRTDDEALAAAVTDHAADVRSAVRVDDLTVLAGGDSGADAHTREWTVDGSAVTLAMEPTSGSRA